MSQVNSMSLRARINNFARKDGISPQLALQSFFIERFLARIEKSAYAGNLVIKGGTLMCEKVQSILKRGVATTRPRDFYDLHMLSRRVGFDIALFARALHNTIVNRNSEEYLKNWRDIVEAIATSDFQRQQWRRYQKRMPYAHDISFDDLMESLAGLMGNVHNILKEA